MQQEILYNIGKAYQEIKLNHIATDFYLKAIKLHDENPTFAASKLNVTKEAVFNLIIIYKKSKAIDLAIELMDKYLIF